MHYVITWLFRRFHDATIALLAGIMLGSLNKVWPWKEVVETIVTGQGKVIPLTERSISPFAYRMLTNQDPMVLQALMAAIMGMLTILLLEKWAAKAKPN
jgi:putative membrane protein